MFLPLALCLAALVPGSLLPLAIARAEGTPVPDDSRAATAVVYHATVQGEPSPGRGIRVLVGQDGLARLFEPQDGEPLPTAPVEIGYFDLTRHLTRQTAQLPDGSRFTVTTPFDSLARFELTTERKEILGYECAKATTSIRSNRIDVWFTREAGLSGSPSLQLVVPDALVLEFVQNGSSGFVAERVERDAAAIRELLAAQPSPFAPVDWGEEVDGAEYRGRVTRSWVTTVKIFEHEQISFGNEIRNLSDPENGEVLRYSEGTVLVRKVVLPRVDDDTIVLAELVEVSNGDAYDRTGSVFLIPTDRARSYLDGLRSGIAALPVTRSGDEEYQGIVATEDYLPPLELLRVITPFGVGHYNDRSRVQGLTWADEASYVMDVTDLLPRLQGEAWFGAFIGNYDRGGHRVSLTLRYYPGSKVRSGDPPARRWTLPLFNTLNAMEMSGQNYGTIFGHDSLSVEFDVPEGLVEVQLRYRTTGHGGWGGGDEFNPKPNTILLDGGQVASFIPWRSDCGTFRELNPSSGNFWNGISSSDFSRSGWCPGATVSPVIVPLDGLAPGRHRMQIAIPMGPREGGSFSSWNVSGVLIGRFAE